MYVRAGRPAFARPCVGIHKSTSLMSSSLLLQQCPACLVGNYTRMLRAILNKSWQQHPTRHQLYGHLPPITKTIQVRRTRHAGHCWRSEPDSGLTGHKNTHTHTHIIYIYIYIYIYMPDGPAKRAGKV